MDHTDLIRNTSLEDQREQIEAYATAQIQVEHLSTLIREQQDAFEMHSNQHERERTNLERNVERLEKALD